MAKTNGTPSNEKKFEELNSKSENFVEDKNPIETYGNGIFKNLGGIIKAISFIIAFFIIALSFVAAFFIFSKQAFYMALAIAIIIFGTVLAAIVMFLIYGLGHVICQNNEILKHLKK